MVYPPLSSPQSFVNLQSRNVFSVLMKYPKSQEGFFELGLQPDFLDARVCGYN